MSARLERLAKQLLKKLLELWLRRHVPLTTEATNGRDRRADEEENENRRPNPRKRLKKGGGGASSRPRIRFVGQGSEQRDADSYENWEGEDSSSEEEVEESLQLSKHYYHSYLAHLTCEQEEAQPAAGPQIDPLQTGKHSKSPRLCLPNDVPTEAMTGALGANTFTRRPHTVF